MTKRFVGHLLLRGNDVLRQQALRATCTVHRTQKGRFAPHVHTEPDWGFADPEASDDFDEIDPQEFRLNGFDTMKELDSRFFGALTGCGCAASIDTRARVADMRIGKSARGWVVPVRGGTQ